MRPLTVPARSSTSGAASFAGEAILATYRGLAVVASPILSWIVARRVVRGKADAARYAERFGQASLARPSGRIAWVHAASVGETLAVLPLVARIAGEGLGVVFTSGTMTSATLAAERLPLGAVHQYPPLDVAPYVRRFLDHWRPELAVIVESEVWPTTVMALERRNVPLVVVNGRLSDRSFPRWRRFAPLVAPLFARFSLVLAQSDEDARRFAALGAGNVQVSGNLKWDAQPLSADPGEIARLRRAIGDRPVWLAASTHPGEEEIVAAVHKRLSARRPNLLTVIVPRHPERGAEVAQVIAGADLKAVRRSLGEDLSPTADVYVADTLGELGLFYRLTSVAFIGNSIVDGGGHNPLEAVQLGTAVVSGPHVRNFADTFARLDRVAAGPAITDAAGLAAAIGRLLDDPAASRVRVAAQAAALAGMNGALERTMAALAPYLATRAAA